MSIDLRPKALTLEFKSFELNLSNLESNKQTNKQSSILSVVDSFNHRSNPIESINALPAELVASPIQRVHYFISYTHELTHILGH
jgi:hypothetical protein